MRSTLSFACAVCCLIGAGVSYDAGFRGTTIALGISCFMLLVMAGVLSEPQGSEA